MRKRMNFDNFYGDGWPLPQDLKHYFLSPAGQQWFSTGGNDTAGLSSEGVDGTEHLQYGEGRVDIRFRMWGNPKLGVMLVYSKLGGPGGFAFTSKGDFSRQGLYTQTLHGDSMPAWLYVPFEEAWKAVKEFIESDGALPKSIEWISNKDLASDTFPESIPERLGGPRLRYIE